MEENNVKQLVILGNGFDLACGLKSRYDDYFKQRFEKVDENEVIDKLLQHKPNKNGSALNLNVYGVKNHQFKRFKSFDPQKDYETNVNYFDLLFMATRRYMKLDDSWSNVEQILQEVLRLMYYQCDNNGFDTSEEIYLKAKSLKDKCFNNYKFNSTDDKIEFITFVLHIFNNTVQDGEIEKSLKKYEKTFGRFIASQINESYIDKVNSKLNALIPQKADILSFNYSATPLFDSKLSNNEKINNWYNVHGLARFDPSARTRAIHKVHDMFLKIPRPIFGISRYDQVNKEFLSKKDPVYLFTKDNRRDEKINDMSYNFLKYEISPSIKLVTVFGHSLGMTDYDYFKKIFQKLNLANGKLCLQIYYCNNDDRQNKEMALKQMLDEYSHDASINADDLYNKLCQENRLSYKEIVVNKI